MKSFGQLLLWGTFVLLLFLTIAGDRQAFALERPGASSDLFTTVGDNATCPPVQNTPNFSLAYGEVTMEGDPAPVGTVVTALSPRGEVIGCVVVTTEGHYGTMYIYGEDATVEPPIPGMRAGEEVTFQVEGCSAQATLVLIWENDRAFHKVNLSAEEGFIQYFPMIFR